ncbi:benzoate/H(+) symporter BenE family transporter [Actinoplanes oblitus]|uniref:Benzoate/H(+) symporter BenE family transporter n=1 Tax=Actinoplanes oblitus TaxID=3040509 RepID=A0ABY8WAT7_9ACTN|nr:benzoate/H(+) symporter BenE family transporter [Actinoplanes oblitus]WIM94974.1 benzoate/H(+) symporter BenE family transporter [Actinoplanes oblitus]
MKVPISALVAGLVAVLVSFSGPFVVVLTAASAAHLTTAQTTSWVWAIAVGSGLSGLVLSLVTRMPVITAWSTPGAALLVGSLGAYRYSDAIGAFLFAAAGMTILGFSGLFGRILARVPRGIISAMLAGILLPFALEAFRQLPGAPAIVLSVLVGYFLGRRLLPNYAVLFALAAGTLVAALGHDLHLGGIPVRITLPHLTVPSLNWSALVSIGLPLLIVTMASQNAPGLAVLKSSGYQPDDRLLLTGTGLTSVLLAPFGSHGINLAAITAAICTGEQAHPNPRLRYVAGVACGAFYLVCGLLGTGLVGFFTALPKPLVAAVCGVALLGALLGSLAGALDDRPAREGALVTLAATASGMTVAHVGAAFWGLVAGVGVHLVLTRFKAPREPQPDDETPDDEARVDRVEHR